MEKLGYNTKFKSRCIGSKSQLTIHGNTKLFERRSHSTNKDAGIIIRTKRLRKEETHNLKKNILVVTREIGSNPHARLSTQQVWHPYRSHKRQTFMSRSLPGVSLSFLTPSCWYQCCQVWVAHIQWVTKGSLSRIAWLYYMLGYTRKLNHIHIFKLRHIHI